MKKICMDHPNMTINIIISILPKNIICVLLRWWCWCDGGYDLIIPVIIFVTHVMT